MPTLPYHSTYTIIWFLMQIFHVSNLEVLDRPQLSEKEHLLDCYNYNATMIMMPPGTRVLVHDNPREWPLWDSQIKIKMLNFTSLISPLVPWSIHWTNIPQSQKHSGLIPQQLHYVNPNLHVCHNPCSHVSEPWPGNLWPSSTILNLGHQTGCTFMRPGRYIPSVSPPNFW